MRHRLNTEFLQDCKDKGLLSELLKLANNDQEARIDFTDYFATIKKEIAGANRITIVDTDSIREVGVSDFHSGKFSGAELGIIVKSLLIGYASSTDTKVANELIPTLQFWYTAEKFANQVLASNLIVAQGGKEWKKIPVEMMVSDGKVLGPISMVADYEMEHWNYLKGDEPVLIQLELPKVALSPDKRHFVSITLRGDSIVRY